MMHPIVKFFVDFFLLLYFCIKPIIYIFIPNSLMFKDLKDETVLITGGGGGIGHSLAVKLAALGCRVVVWDVNEKGGQRTVKLIRDKGGIAHFYPCDVSRKKDVYSTSTKVKYEIGQVSILINNAGIVSAKSLLMCPDEMIEKTFQVNATSHFWTCKAFLPDMITKNHGHIVTIASIAGYISICGLADYSASKSAAISFHESLFMELKRNNCTGIKTTLVCPNHINTDLFRGFDLRLFPTMEPEYVANKIISAIRRNEEMAFIPGYMGFFATLKSIFPISAATKAIEMFNGFNAMDRVVGTDIRRTQLIQ